MKFHVFLNESSFDCLYKSVPKGSRSREPLDQAVRLEARGFSAVVGNIAIECDEEESRDLLNQAQVHCQTAVESIRLALRSAGIRV